MAQQLLLAIIRDHLSDGMFSSLNKVFPGSDLLQKYSLYTTIQLHRKCSDIHAIYEKMSVTSLQSAADFHRVM